MAGRSIRIFLADGTPQGIRTAEVGNWTGLALVGPRTELPRLGQRKEVLRTGVYILIGPGEESSLAVYVGEGDDVWQRLRSHQRDEEKDWWTWVVLFVSKDENLTKAHVRWLEARLVADIAQAKRAELRNGNQPIGGGLPEADASDMDTFLDHIRLLLPVLGADVFGVQQAEGGGAAPEADLILELYWEDAGARCAVRDGKFVVLAGSTFRRKETETLGKQPRTTRAALVTADVLVPDSENSGLFRLTQDYAFDSPSGAGAAVTGTNVNGRLCWKLEGTNKTYKSWEEDQVASTDPEPTS